MLSKAKKQTISSTTSSGLAPSNHSTSAAIYLHKPHHHHQLPAAAASYFHTNSPTSGYSTGVSNGTQQTAPSATTCNAFNSLILPNLTIYLLEVLNFLFRKFENMFVWKYNLAFLKERKALTFYQKVKKGKRKDFSLNQYFSIIK